MTAGTAQRTVRLPATGRHPMRWLFASVLAVAVAVSLVSLGTQAFQLPPQDAPGGTVLMNMKK
jgi:hypothetical protein